jgi:hypothetical protein
MKLTQPISVSAAEVRAIVLRSQALVMSTAASAPDVSDSNIPREGIGRTVKTNQYATFPKFYREVDTSEQPSTSGDKYLTKQTHAVLA